MWEAETHHDYDDRSRIATEQKISISLFQFFNVTCWVQTFATLGVRNPLPRVRQSFKPLLYGIAARVSVTLGHKFDVEEREGKTQRQKRKMHHLNNTPA